MSHTDFAPIAFYAALIGHRYVAGLAHGAAEARDVEGVLKMMLLGLALQGGICTAALLLNESVLPTWGYVLLAGVCAASTMAPALKNRADIRVFSIGLGMVTIYALLGGLVATVDTGVLLICAVVPGLLATMSGWNRGAGYYALGEPGAPVPRVLEGIVWTAGVSVLCAIVFFTYKIIT